MEPDARFLNLFEATVEFDPTDNKYEAYRAFNLRPVERGRVLVDWLRQEHALVGLRVVDVGCGSGGLAIALAEAGAVVDAIPGCRCRFP
jgi:2-polyprenyl-3-methyl-5-hydroxy-6-metoxy-1,4-benzoquinol methylase